MTEINNRRDFKSQKRVNIRQQSGYQQQMGVVEDLTAGQRVIISRIAQWIWLFFGVTEAFLGFRIVLKWIKADPANPFVYPIYRFTDFLLWPFSGLTVTPKAQGMVWEISSIIALVVYALLAWIMVRLLWMFFYRPATRSAPTVEREDFSTRVK